MCLQMRHTNTSDFLQLETQNKVLYFGMYEVARNTEQKCSNLCQSNQEDKTKQMVLNTAVGRKFIIYGSQVINLTQIETSTVLFMSRRKSG